MAKDELKEVLRWTRLRAKDHIAREAFEYNEGNYTEAKEERTIADTYLEVANTVKRMIAARKPAKKARKS